jgi:hypothetical protein
MSVLQLQRPSFQKNTLSFTSIRAQCVNGFLKVSVIQYQHHVIRHLGYVKVYINDHWIWHYAIGAFSNLMPPKFQIVSQSINIG